jgi:hypothetical protein
VRFVPSAPWARWLAAGATALACLLGGAYLHSRNDAPGVVAGAAATAEVVRTTLLDSRTATGTLGYGHPVDVQFISRARTGIVTWIAPEGTVVARGEPLYAIDGQPVVLFYGELPLFRSLRFHGDAYTSFDWLELDNARDDERKAGLELSARGARVAEARLRLEEIQLHAQDAGRAQPVTPQFVRLAQAVAAAEDRLRRIEQLAKSQYASPAELQQARYELAAAQAELDAGRRDRTQQLATARTALAEAELAAHQAERLLRDAGDVRRALLASASNTDIEILRTNLAELGHKGPAAAAIRAWQKQVGRSQTGLIEPGQIIVASGPVRVAAHLAEVGDVLYSRTEGRQGLVPDGTSSSQVLRFTSTERVVTVALQLSDHDYARPGDAVTVTLPTDTEVQGRISKVSAHFNEQGRADAEIAIPAQEALGAVEAAVVEVEFVVGRREDVLAVPVSALVALAEGGFGVEVVEGGPSRLVPVETGLFARGQVEISGVDITEGLTVRIPP